MININYPHFAFRNERLRQILVITLSALLGFALAMLIVSWPMPGMAAPIVLAAIVVFIRQPKWLMLAFFTSLAIPIQRSIGGIALNASDGLLVLWCVLWPFMMARNGNGSLERWRVPALVVFIAPFVVAVLLSQVNSISPSASFKQVLRVVEWFVLLPIALSVIIPDARFQRFAGLMLMLVPCLFSIDGIYEYFNNGQTLSGILGISVPIPEGSESQIRHTFDISGRAGSSFGGAQGLAMYLVMTMGFSIAHFFYCSETWLKRLALFCFLLSIGGLAVAQSRGGFIGAFAVVVAIVLTVNRRLRVPIIMIGLTTLAIGLGFLGNWSEWDGTIAGLVPGGRPEAVLDRLILWNVVWDVFYENPFLGVGLGNFRDAFFANEAWLHVELAYPSLHAHSTYLELLADTGAIGLFAFLLFLLLTTRRLLVLWETGGQPILTLAAIGSLAAYLVFAMVDMLLLQNIHLLLLLVLSVGMADKKASMLGVLRNKPFGESL
jgi:O-antigen ligase